MVGKGSLQPYLSSLYQTMYLSRFLCRILTFLLFLSGGSVGLLGQVTTHTEPTIEGDTLVEVVLPPVNVYADRSVRPMTPEERQQLWRLIRDVKVTYPYAKYVAATIIETYEYMETLPEKSREAHLKLVEKDLKREMTPKMKNLTLRQGKILIKLIHRQCGMTGYELLKTFLGGFKAWTWQLFARVTGASLKSPYDPLHNQEDATIERIIHLYEQRRL